MPIGEGEEENRVYHFRGIVLARAHKISRIPETVLWHQCLGHSSKKVLSVFLSTLDNFDVSVLILKSIMMFAFKQNKLVNPSQKVLIKKTYCFSLIHCDVWGPYSIPSSCGAHYFFTIIDDYSRAVWTHLLLAKSEVASVLKNFFAMTERQFGKRVQTMRSDNGTEFTCMKSFFTANGNSSSNLMCGNTTTKWTYIT